MRRARRSARRSIRSTTERSRRGSCARVPRAALRDPDLARRSRDVVDGEVVDRSARYLVVSGRRVRRLAASGPGRAVRRDRRGTASTATTTPQPRSPPAPPRCSPADAARRRRRGRRRHRGRPSAGLRATHAGCSPQLTVVGITGSQGKTRPRICSAQLLEPEGGDGRAGGFDSTTRSAFRSLCCGPTRHRFLVVEMGARGRGHIQLPGGIVHARRRRRAQCRRRAYRRVRIRGRHRGRPRANSSRRCPTAVSPCSTPTTPRRRHGAPDVGAGVTFGAEPRTRPAATASPPRRRGHASVSRCP